MSEHDLLVVTESLRFSLAYLLERQQRAEYRHGLRSQLLEIARQLTNAVAFLHAQGPRACVNVQ